LDTGTSRDNIFSKINNIGNSLNDNPAPCAVCYAAGRSTIFNFPARTQCPDGWTIEYAGYLVSDCNYANHKRSKYICWDEAPEVAVGGTAQVQAVICPVEVQCGSLPCSVYPNGRELNCISSIPGVKMIPFPPYKAPQTQSRLPSPTKTEYSDF